MFSFFFYLRLLLKTNNKKAAIIHRVHPCVVISCTFTGSGCQEAPGHQDECVNRARPSEGQSHLRGVHLHLIPFGESEPRARAW